MIVHPIHVHEIHQARQKDREAEASTHRIKQLTRGKSLGHRFAVGLGSFFSSVLAAIGQVLSNQPRLAENKDTR